MITKKYMCCAAFFWFLVSVCNAQVVPSKTAVATLPADSQSVGVAGGAGINIPLDQADSNTTIHFARQGVYFTPDALSKNQSGGTISNFNIPRKVLHDRAKDSLMTVQLVEKEHADRSQLPAINAIWAFSDGKTIFINAQNRYFSDAFYPLIVKAGHYYYRAYNGPDPMNSSVLGGIAIGLGTGFSVGPIGFGLSSSMPLASHQLFKRKLPGHHLVWMEYMMRGGHSVELKRSPF